MCLNYSLLKQIALRFLFFFISSKPFFFLLSSLFLLLCLCECVPFVSFHFEWVNLLFEWPDNCLLSHFSFSHLLPLQTKTTSMSLAYFFRYFFFICNATNNFGFFFVYLKLWNCFVVISSVYSISFQLVEWLLSVVFFSHFFFFYLVHRCHFLIIEMLSKLRIAQIKVYCVITSPLFWK